MRLLFLTISITLLTQLATAQPITTTSTAPLSIDRGTAYMNLLQSEGGEIR